MLGEHDEGILFNGPGGDLVVRNSSIVDNGGSGTRALSTLASQTGIVHVMVDSVDTSLNQQGIRFVIDNNYRLGRR